MDKDTHFLISDGTIMRYGQAGELHPVKHQQLLVLDDGSFLVFTVAMYGGIYAFQGEYDNPYYQGSIHKLNPLAEAFDEVYFENMVRGLKKMYPPRLCWRQNNVYRDLEMGLYRIFYTMPVSIPGARYLLSGILKNPICCTV